MMDPCMKNFDEHLLYSENYTLFSDSLMETNCLGKMRANFNVYNT